VDTPSLRGRIASAADPVQAEKDFIARQPMGRLATVDGMTPMVVCLPSDESRFVTGQALLAAGGVTIRPSPCPMRSPHRSTGGET